MRSSEVRSLLERLMPPLYRFCVHLTRDPHLAEDLAQDTMLKAWTHRKRLGDEAGATPWLLAIARNAWRDDRRRARVRRRSDRRIARTDRSTAGLADLFVDLDDEVRAVLAAMEALPERQRDVLFLSAVEGLSNPQIAGVLDISPGAVKASLSLARRRVLEACENEPPLSRRSSEVAP